MSKEPLQRFVEHGLEQGPCSPMEPPEAFSAGTVPQIPYAELAKPLQELLDEHEEYSKVLSVFEQALLQLKQNGWQFTPEVSSGLKRFFSFLDEAVLGHNRKEEKVLFPLLREKFLETGEHSLMGRTITPVEVMEDDHQRVGQSACLVFNLLGLAPRLPDPASRKILLEHAFHLGQEIVETMKLHIYKENTVLFPLAQQMFSQQEWERLAARLSEF